MVLLYAGMLVFVFVFVYAEVLVFVFLYTVVCCEYDCICCGLVVMVGPLAT